MSSKNQSNNLYAVIAINQTSKFLREFRDKLNEICAKDDRNIIFLKDDRYGKYLGVNGIVSFETSLVNNDYVTVERKTPTVISLTLFNKIKQLKLDEDGIIVFEVISEEEGFKVVNEIVLSGIIDTGGIKNVKNFTNDGIIYIEMNCD